MENDGSRAADRRVGMRVLLVLHCAARGGAVGTGSTMTREPDRFEAKARELFHTIPTDPRTLLIDEHRLVWHIAAALRAAESSALKRAAQLFDVKPGGRSRDAKYV